MYAYEAHCFDLPYNSKQIKCHTAVFYRTNKHGSLQQCCQAVEEGMISTLVGWDADALGAFNISNFKFLFGYVNANPAQLIHPTFLKQTNKVGEMCVNKENASNSRNDHTLGILAGNRCLRSYCIMILTHVSA